MEDPSLSISIDYFQSSPSRILNRIFPFTEIKEGSPTPDEVEGLSEKISDKWKKLGRRLQFDQAQITEHDKSNEKLSEKAYNLLMAWKGRDASAATYRVLHKALSDVERSDLAQEFCCQWKTKGILPFSLHYRTTAAGYWKVKRDLLKGCNGSCSWMPWPRISSSWTFHLLSFRAMWSITKIFI